MDASARPRSPTWPRLVPSASGRGRGLRSHGRPRRSRRAPLPAPTATGSIRSPYRRRRRVRPVWGGSRSWWRSPPCWRCWSPRVWVFSRRGDDTAPRSAASTTCHHPAAHDRCAHHRRAHHHRGTHDDRGARPRRTTAATTLPASGATAAGRAARMSPSRRRRDRHGRGVAPLGPAPARSRVSAALVDAQGAPVRPGEHGRSEVIQPGAVGHASTCWSPPVARCPGGVRARRSVTSA